MSCITPLHCPPPAPPQPVPCSSSARPSLDRLCLKADSPDTCKGSWALPPSLLPASAWAWHHLSTSVTGAQPGLCCVPLNLGTRHQCRNRCEACTHWSPRHQLQRECIQEALSEDRDGGRSVTGSTLGYSWLPPCHRAPCMMSKEETCFLLFFPS